MKLIYRYLCFYRVLLGFQLVVGVCFMFYGVNFKGMGLFFVYRLGSEETGEEDADEPSVGGGGRRRRRRRAAGTTARRLRLFALCAAAGDQRRLLLLRRRRRRRRSVRHQVRRAVRGSLNF